MTHRVFLIQLTDGRATMLAPEGMTLEAATARVKSQFKAERVISVRGAA